jgi:hypothetical protein
MMPNGLSGGEVATVGRGYEREVLRVEIVHPEIGVCGLSCRLCPRYHTQGESRCTGCKGEQRMSAGCPFITCAVKRKGIEFCWDCADSAECERWARHRELGRTHDSFVSYAGLEATIACVQCDGLEAFVAEQDLRESLLCEMLEEFNEGRSKAYYCIAATVLPPDELRRALTQARETSREMDPRARSKALHALLDAAADMRSVTIALRK